MDTAASRSFIAALQVTLDGYILGPDGEVDWVDSWADGLGTLPEVDAFLLGGGMLPEYAEFWTAIRDDPAAAAEWLGREPYPRELEYARVAGRTPHLVLSTTLPEVGWPTARIVRSLDELRAFRAAPGRAVYVVGGPQLLRSLIAAELLDELRLIVHPVLAGGGTPLFGGAGPRRALVLAGSEQLASGRVLLSYRVAAAAPAHVG